MKKKKAKKSKHKLSNFGIFMVTFFLTMFVLIGVVAGCALRLKLEGANTSDAVCLENLSPLGD